MKTVITAASSRVPDPSRRPGGELYGERRAHLLKLFDNIVTINAKHVALCLGISEKNAGVMLATAARDGKVTRVEYTIRRHDGVTVGYQRGTA